MPALDDLKVSSSYTSDVTDDQECLFKVDQRSVLVEKLRAA
jgi:hypothetical protein